MRDPALYRALESLAAEASAELVAATEEGAEIPFEIAEETAGRSVLYRYRPLVGPFMDARASTLRRLAPWAGAVEALARVETSGYLNAQGDGAAQAQAVRRADAAALCFLKLVWEDASTFEWEQERFERAYGELEELVFKASLVWVVAARMPGFELEVERVDLEDGLALVAPDVAGAPPPSAAAEGPHALLTYVTEAPAGSSAPTQAARAAFRRALTALRLFKHGAATVEPLGFVRHGDGPWQVMALGLDGRRARRPYRVRAGEDAELRDFYAELEKRASKGGPLEWALRRFALGWERPEPLEGLSDHLLALRALLDGTDDSRFALRLAALCARPQERAVAARQVEDAIALERTVRRGLLDPAEARSEQGDFAPMTLVLRMEENLRAVLRDALSGALERDLRAVADEVIAADAQALPPLAEEPAPEPEPWAPHPEDEYFEALPQAEHDPDEAVTVEMRALTVAPEEPVPGPPPPIAGPPRQVDDLAPLERASAAIRIRAGELMDEIGEELEPEPHSEPEPGPFEAWQGHDPDALAYDLPAVEDAECWSAPV